MDQQDPAQDRDRNGCQHCRVEPGRDRGEKGKDGRPDRRADPLQRDQPAPVALQFLQRGLFTIELPLEQDIGHQQRDLHRGPGEQNCKGHLPDKGEQQRGKRSDRGEQRQTRPGHEIVQSACQEQAAHRIRPGRTGLGTQFGIGHFCGHEFPSVVANTPDAATRDTSCNPRNSRSSNMRSRTN